MALPGHGTRSNSGHNRHNVILDKPLQKAATEVAYDLVCVYRNCY